MSTDFHHSGKGRVKRLPKRGFYDKETIYKILDEGIVCHISFILDNQPFIIPTSYARVDDAIYIHGAKTSRLLNIMDGRNKLCVSVTLLDSYVMARSAFHHSMNYHSAILFGTGEIIHSDDEKLIALKVFSDHLVPGRWEDARQPSEKELHATHVVKIIIDEASAKIRTGPPSDDEEDYGLDVWAGLLQFKTVLLDPVDDPRLKDGVNVPEYIQKFIKDKNS